MSQMLTQGVSMGLRFWMLLTETYVALTPREYNAQLAERGGVAITTFAA